MVKRCEARTWRSIRDTQNVKDSARVSARQLAVDVLNRIETGNAFANLVLGPALERSGLDRRDRAFVTQLVYGTVRMTRALDFLIDRFTMREVDPKVRTLLRLGTYQIHYLATPSYAAVNDTVALAPRKVRGFVNAILRKVVAHPITSDTQWPSEATRLSYPDWIVESIASDHGMPAAIEACEVMNREPEVHVRDDGYTQDLASQWVVEALGVREGDLVADVCAAPGGKATLMASAGARVMASDRRASRARLIKQNTHTLSLADVGVVIADATAPGLRSKSFDVVLVDAPCSGIGVLRRRADARWRLEPEAPQRLAQLQKEILTSSAELVKSGAVLAYSVCTITREETLDVVEVLGPEFEPIPVPEPEIAPEPTGQSTGQSAGQSDTGVSKRWRKWGNGALLLPQDHNTDGMSLFMWRRKN